MGDKDNNMNRRDHQPPTPPQQQQSQAESSSPSTQTTHSIPKQSLNSIAKESLALPTSPTNNPDRSTTTSTLSSTKGDPSLSISPSSNPTFAAGTGTRTIRRKLVVVGDGACGKTSLLVAYKDDTFTSEYVPTVFETSTVCVPVEDKIVELSLWDTAGQEDYDRLRPLSYPDSDVILICFAIDKPDSLASVQRKWIYELEQYCANVPRILVGCKSDLRTDKSVINRTLIEAGESMAERIDAVSHIECSALTRENIEQVFAQAARVSLTFTDRRKSKSHQHGNSGLTTNNSKKKLNFCIIQ